MITLTDSITTLTLQHVLWLNRATEAGVAGSEQPTIGGRLAVQRMAGAGGREIVLSADLDGSQLKGRWSWSQVEQFMVWRDAGTTLELDYDGEVRSVMIPIDGINIAQVRPGSSAPAVDTVCAGTLTLLEV